MAYKPYEQIEHTADICLKIYGKNLSELFHNAALGLCGLLSKVEKVKGRQKKNVTLNAENREELLVAWLNEIIFHFSTHEFIPKNCQIHHVAPTSMQATILGEKLNPSVHVILPEIKAATYHELFLNETNEGLEAQVIFDT